MTNIIPIVTTLIVAVIASQISRIGLKSDSYKSLNLSPNQPQNIVFGIVWTIIYVSFAFVWYKYVTTKLGHLLFTTNILLNLLWVFLFFGAGKVISQSRLDMSKIVIISLLILTLYQAYYMWVTVEKNSALPTFILLVYASWLLCATGLNLATTIK